MARIMDTRCDRSKFRIWRERFRMSCSHDWAKECTEFTSNHKRCDSRLRVPIEISPKFSTFIHRQGLLCTGKSPRSPKPSRYLLEVTPAFIDIFSTQV